MKSVEEICDRFNRTPEEVEHDLYCVLYEISGGKQSLIKDLNYKDCIYRTLIYRNCALADTIGYEITEEGIRVLDRGWITKDFNSLKNKEQKEQSIKYWTLVAGIITAVATLLTAFLTIFK